MLKFTKVYIIQPKLSVSPHKTEMSTHDNAAPLVQLDWQVSM